MATDAPLTERPIADMSSDALTVTHGFIGVDIESLERKLEDTQAALSKKRKLRTDIKRELVGRTIADEQNITKAQVKGKSTSVKLRMLAALVRAYINEVYAEFYGGGLGVHTAYDSNAACVTFGRGGAYSIRIEPDGTASRESWETHTVNVLNDHPRTWNM